MKVLIRTLVICFVAFTSMNAAFGREGTTVKGIVTTFRNYPLNHVKIYSLKSGEIVYTDSSGSFSIESYRGDVLILTASGFFTTKFEVRKKDFYPVDMVYIDSDTNFQIATQSGHISPAMLQKAIMESYMSNQHDYSKYNSIYQLVSSEVYNVRVKGNTIISTKMRSLDPNPQVLLVVDDKIVSDISFIDPSWVRSIELIDDVRATMYGSLGANGILRITLK
jgi:hypothetical protein